MMGLRLWEVGRARESKFLQPTAAPGTSRRGLDLESDALLTTNHFTCGFLKLNDPRAGSQGKTGEAGTVDTLVIKWKKLAIFFIFVCFLIQYLYIRHFKLPSSSLLRFDECECMNQRCPFLMYLKTKNLSFISLSPFLFICFLVWCPHPHSTLPSPSIQCLQSALVGTS